MSVSKVQRSKSATASVVYAVWGTKVNMQQDNVRAGALSVVGPRGSHPMAWAVETRERVADSVQRQNETINVIQSFSPDELNPDSVVDVERAHSAGLALAEKVAPGCDVIVATHTDTAHVHNHIIIANHDRDTGMAAPKEAGNAWRVREVNDDVMKTLDLEVLEQHPVSYSRDERMAQSKGLDIDGSGLSLDELTRENWREFARARIEELMEDDRVIEALVADVDDDEDEADGNGVESAFDVMEDIAPEYHLSFSRKGRGKRKNERSSFALVDDDGEVLRVSGANGKGSARAATAGSRLGADFTMNGLRALLLEIQAEETIYDLSKDGGLEDYGTKPTTKNPTGQRRDNERTVSDSKDPRGRYLGTATDDKGDSTIHRGVGRLPDGIPSAEPQRAVRDLRDATDRTRRSYADLAAFNSWDERVREGDGSGHGVDEGDVGDSGLAAGGDSTSVRSVADGSVRDREPLGGDGRAPGDRRRNGRRASESERRRHRKAERLHGEAVESISQPDGSGGDGPDF